MKILHQDENKLVVRRSGTLFLTLIGILFMGMGLVTSIGVSTKHHLTCERIQRTRTHCQLERTLLGIPVTTETIETLQGVRLDSSFDDENETYTYQVVLIAAGVEKKLGPDTAANHAQRKQFVEETHRFIQSPGLSQLDIVFGEAKYMWIGIPFFLVGLLTFIVGIQSRFTTWTFDRVKGTLVHRRETVLGVKVQEYALQDIVDIRITKETDSEGDITYNLELVLRGGNPIYMGRVSSSAVSGNRAAAAIRDFLTKSGYY